MDNKVIMKDIDEVLADIRLSNYYNFRLSVVERIYGKSSSFNQFMISAGFAGLYALLSLSEEHLTQKSYIVSLVSLGLSVFFYVTYTLIKMLYDSVSAAMLANELKNVPDSLEALEYQINKADMKIKRAGLIVLILWPFFFIPAVVFGAICLGVLFYSWLDILNVTYYMDAAKRMLNF